MALSLLRSRYGFPVDPHSPVTLLLTQRSTIERERSMTMLLANYKVVHHLPDNLIFEILSWLPVKDLLRFKTVSKSWCAIISSPPFVSKHLQNYYSNDDVDWRCCLLVQYHVTQGELLLHQLFVDETPRVLAHEEVYVSRHSSRIYGPCNGLYYVYEYTCSYRALWNPSINQLHRLPNIISKPDFPSLYTYFHDEVYGLGLDPLSGDHKVVVIKGYVSIYDDNQVMLPPSVLVYSLRTDSWKYCGDLDAFYDLGINKCCIYVNGCCYWFGSYEFSWGVIISFDFATDAYEEICVPDYPTDSYRELHEIYYYHPNTKCLGVYDDCLAFLCFHNNEQILDIWTWEKEGSWTKKFSAGPFPHVLGPIGHWKDNRIILLSQDHELLLFDPETQEVRDLGFQTKGWCEGVFAYMESLVSLKDMNNCELSEQDEAKDSQV